MKIVQRVFIYLCSFLILPVLGKGEIFNASLSMDHAAHLSLYSAPCVVGLIDKYQEDSAKVWGATVVLSIMLNSVLRQRFYLAALNSFHELTFMIKRADVPHHSAAWVTEKAQLYFIFISDAEDIRDHIVLFKSLPTYTTYAKIIGLFLGDMTEEQFREQRERATKILFESDFFDIFMMGLKHNSSILQTYTMFPYDNGNCARNVNPVELVDECEFLAKDHTRLQTMEEVFKLSKNRTNMRYVEYKKYFPKLPTELTGCKVNVTTSTFEPYVVVSKKTNLIEKGLEIELMNATFLEKGASLTFIMQDPTLRYQKRSLDNSSVYRAILWK